MASDWIKMRPGMQSHLKVTMLADALLSDPAFREWMPGVDADVTQPADTVTFEIVTHVVVGALMNVWGALNHVIDSTDRVGRMQIEHVDRMCRVPGMGQAMAAVDWIRVEDDALWFPNFAEFNTPDKERSAPKSNAQRKREQRAREKAASDAAPRAENVTRCHAGHEMSRGEEKSREEQTQPDARARETPPPTDDPEIDAAVAADQPNRQAVPADTDKSLRFGEIVTVLDSHGTPYHWTTGGPGRDALLAWSEAGVTRADITEAYARAYQHKTGDGPVGPKYLDPIIRQVVNERLHPRPNNERGDYATGERRGGRSADAVAQALDC